MLSRIQCSPLYVGMQIETSGPDEGSRHSSEFADSTLDSNCIFSIAPANGMRSADMLFNQALPVSHLQSRIEFLRSRLRNLRLKADRSIHCLQHGLTKIGNVPGIHHGTHALLDELFDPA